jgi:predicted nucleotidyltransferase/HEPN domain-containing protein
MRSSLDQLPDRYRRELERVLEIIFEEFEDAFKISTSPRKKKGRILKIVLFGSFARGDFVDERLKWRGYRSDYDLLIIVNHKELTDLGSWSFVEDRLSQEAATQKRLRREANLIVHTWEEVTEALAKGQFFFADVVKDGIVLYDADKREFPPARPLTRRAAFAAAGEHYQEWFASALQFLSISKDCLERGWLKKSAFLLHQSVESAYHCTLTVLTNYTPNSHSIRELRSKAEDQDRRLIEAWPRATKRERTNYNKLVEAYVKARYSKHFKITKEELDWLIGCTSVLNEKVEQVCKQRLSFLSGKTANR